MTNAADALVKNDSPENFQELQKAANSLLTKELTLGDKRMVFCYLKLSLLGDESLLFAAPKMTDSQQLISEQLEGLEIKLEINTWNDDLTNSSLRALHEALPNTRQLAWSDQLFAILAETTLPENGRMRISDNLAGLYGHHLNMFRVNKREEPDWDIVQTATFVLDIADEEFRQEKKYDKKYNTDSGITLRTDFKKNFLNWIEINLQDFQEAGFGGSPLKIFNQLCVYAKEGQALRLSQEKK
jgi:hypothetical protein